MRTSPIWGTSKVLNWASYTILGIQIWFLVGDFGLGNQNVSALRGRGFGMIGVGGVERMNSLLSIVLLLPDALIAMNATEYWSVFDGMIADLN